MRLASIACRRFFRPACCAGGGYALGRFRDNPGAAVASTQPPARSAIWTAIGSTWLAAAPEPAPVFGKPLPLAAGGGVETSPGLVMVKTAVGAFPNDTAVRRSGELNGKANSVICGGYTPSMGSVMPDTNRPSCPTVAWESGLVSRLPRISIETVSPGTKPEPVTVTCAPPGPLFGERTIAGRACAVACDVASQMHASAMSVVAAVGKGSFACIPLTL
jgi:hypothetical protein